MRKSFVLIMSALLFISCGRINDDSQVDDLQQKLGPSFDEILEVLKNEKDGVFARQASDAISYLTANNFQGLKFALRNNYEGNPSQAKITVVEESHKNNQSIFKAVLATKYKGSVQTSETLSRKYCTSFKEYKDYFGAAGVSDIANIVPYAQSPDGTSCSFDFTSISILGFKMEYSGKLLYYVNEDKTLFVEVNYLTKAKSQVSDMMVLTIVYVNDEQKVQTVVFNRSSIPAGKIKHGIAIKEAKRTALEKLQYLWKFLSSR